MSIKNTSALSIYQVSTTAWEEEDMILVTTLAYDDITKVLEPIIIKFRDEENDDWDNEYLVNQLKIAYPDAYIMYTEPDGIELIGL